MKGAIKMPSISIAKGRGSLNHNKRKFKTKNVDQQRSVLNRVLVDEELPHVYNELFDAALERYNAKQKRNDRKISNYLQHIRNSKQEKPFHELVVQIGNKDDMEHLDPNALADMLQQYLIEFEQRNPQMQVYYAVIHMDEATPHLHLDYVPFITGQKRGLETRVSNDKAIQQMGYKDWSSWRTNEMNSLADILHQHGMKRTVMHDNASHLSVDEYKRIQHDVDRKTERLMKQNQELKKENTKLKQQLKLVDSPDAEVRQLQKENNQLQTKIESLNKDLKWYKELSQKLIDCIQSIVHVVVNFFDISLKELDDELTAYDVDSSQTMSDYIDEQSLEKSNIH